MCLLTCLFNHLGFSKLFGLVNWRNIHFAIVCLYHIIEIKLCLSDCLFRNLKPWFLNKVTEEHPPHTFFYHQLFKWVVFGSTLPLCFVPSNNSYWSCLGAASPLFFFLHYLKMIVFGSTLPVYFSLSINSCWLCLETPSPYVFLSPIIQLGHVREHPPTLFFSLLNNSCRSFLGTPSPYIFLSQITQVGHVREHPPTYVFLSPIIQIVHVGCIWEHPLPLFFFLQ